MSGGSYSYIYSRLEDECKNRMYDVELNDLINDLIKVLHDLEWWQSSDIGEDTYRETVAKFKDKWFRADRKERLKGYVDEKCGLLRAELLNLIGVMEEEND